MSIFLKLRHWQSEYYFLGDAVFFASLDLKVPVEEIYRRVNNQNMQQFLQSQMNKQS